MSRFKILAVNPGSTSTKLAAYENDKELFNVTIVHSAEDLKKFKEVQDQLVYREKTVVEEISKQGYTLESFDIYVGRGGGQVPISGGTYEINDKLVEHARIGIAGQHPAQLASQICYSFKKKYNKKAYIVNSPDVDEYQLLARITGLKNIYRSSGIHTLNQKEIALRYSHEHGTDYGKINLIICHIGGGISVTAHRHGKMIDSNNIIRGEGSMTPTRTGELATVTLLDMAFSGKYTRKELYDLLNKNGGIVDHLGTSDMKKVEKRISEGDEYAEVIYNAMIYQIAKSVGEMAVVLQGKVDNIILTGGISYSKKLVAELKTYIDWISEITVMAGEFEMEALASGALRVLTGEEQALEYTGKPVWQGFEEK